MFHSTDNLALNHDGCLYLSTDDGLRFIGEIDGCEDVVGDLGHATEYDEIFDLWRDARGCDYQGQVCADYRQQQGY